MKPHIEEAMRMIGETLDTVMQAKGVSVKDLALIVGMDFRLLLRFLDYGADIQASELLAIASYLECPICFNMSNIDSKTAELLAAGLAAAKNLNKPHDNQ